MISSYLFMICFCFPQVYIVYLGLNQSHDPLLTSKHHHQLLSNVFEWYERLIRCPVKFEVRAFSVWSSLSFIPVFLWIFSPSYSEEAAKQSILYHYKHSFSGFAAKLNENQANILASNELTISFSLFLA